MEFTIKTNKREGIFDITEVVKKIVEKEANLESTACLVYVPHASAAVMINENYDDAICRDILRWLKKQIPQGIWEHDNHDGNADAHIKSSLIGPSKLIPLKDGQMQLGRWQGIALTEFDGPRERRVIVKIL